MKTTLFLGLFGLTVLASCHKNNYETSISSTTTVTNVWGDSATLEIFGESSNKSLPCAWGVSYSTYPKAYSNQREIDQNYEGASHFYKVKLRNLQNNTTYYAQPYAYVNGRRHYSDEEISFTTTPCPDMIGEVGPGGGIIFEYDCDGHGKEMFLTEQSGNWACVSNVFLSANTSTAAGTGLNNSYALSNVCSDPSAAFNECLNFNNNGYSDWYLPSLDDYETIRVNLYNQGLWNPQSTLFLTSSKYQSTYRYNYNMTTGNPSTSPATTSMAYVIVRSF